MTKRILFALATVALLVAGGLASAPAAHASEVFEGKVTNCRSWEKGVHIVLTNGDAGWIEEDSQLVAIAAGAEAAGKPVYIKYKSYDPNWGGGAGHFFDVKMSLAKGNF